MKVKLCIYLHTKTNIEQKLIIFEKVDRIS